MTFDTDSRAIGPKTRLDAELRQVLALGGSDLHVRTGYPSMIRIDGKLSRLNGQVWSEGDVSAALNEIVKRERWVQFEHDHELDMSYTTPTGERFRANLFVQQGRLGAAFRLISNDILSLEKLGMPEIIGRFATLPRGLVLVTGPTGSGKSTTLAALIDAVNHDRADHIMTIEDPIEFVHEGDKSLVNQREVGTDTHSFTAALKHVLRQDPDVILIGEMRDFETISAALTAAETGHLVFGTLHTQDAAQTIDRIVDVFPPHQQAQIRTQLASTLKGIVCQSLIPRTGGKGRVAATEILLTNSAIANLIREGKTFQIPSVMQAGRESGMHTMDQSLAGLVRAGLIAKERALEDAHDPEALLQLISAGQGVLPPIGASPQESMSVN